MSLIARVAGTLRAHELARTGDRVVAAVSGGPDSVALAHLLRDALPRVGAALAGLSHVHHGLRGADADADEAFCRELATALDLPIEVGRFDVAAEAKTRRRSLEATAREIRYRFLRVACGRLGATRLATGHTRNDQAETVLLRLLRGTGTTGLAGVRVRNGDVIRPLIEVSRQEIEEFLRGRQLPFRVDPSNADTSIPRNRIRHVVLPLLEAHATPRAIEALARAAVLAADDEACLAGLAAEAAAACVQRGDGAARVERGVLAGLPHAVQRRLVRRLLEEAAGGRPIGFSQVEAVRAFARSARNCAAMTPVGGVEVSVDAGVLVIRPRRGWNAADLPARGLQSVSDNALRPLPIPGAVEDLDGGWQVHAARGPWRPGASCAGVPPTRATLDADAVGRALFVRTRRPGDRFRPLGLAGTKTLQDFFVDRKVRRDRRDRVPLVVDVRDRIVWVAGHAVGEEFRVTSATTGVLLLELSPLRRLG